MKKGFLSEYFEGATAKRLSAVEADLLRSRQHEFNGVQDLKKILGDPVGKVRYEARFIYMTDADDEMIVDDGFLTWYDAREHHPTRSECRLYFPSNNALDQASPGDLLVIAKRPDNFLLAIVCESGSTIERQVQWLFGFNQPLESGFMVNPELDSERNRLNFASREILEGIGIEAIEEAPDYLDEMLQRFGAQFPPTKAFSDYARSTLEHRALLENPDATLIEWIEREETLFRTMEKHLIEDRLVTGFDEVDEFISYSLSVQNRRKSRAGHALENHLEAIFQKHGLTYSRTPRTEGKRKPDFIFPGIDQYHDNSFPASRLTMLGVKSSCKDRWRQILNEAAKINLKHLLTLEPSISEAQTNEMKEEHVQLVIPEALMATYNEEQRTWLWSVSNFLELLKERQKVLTSPL